MLLPPLRPCSALCRIWDLQASQTIKLLVPLPLQPTPPPPQVYNLIPQYLLLQYTLYRKPLVFNAICKLAMLLSSAVLVLGVVLVWLLYPRAYDYKQASVCGGWEWEGCCRSAGRLLVSLPSSQPPNRRRCVKI